MNGFELLGERAVHRGAIWRVVVGRYRAPDGSTFERDVVRSPGAVGVVPLLIRPDEPARVVLVRQYRPALDRMLVEIPAGMRDVEEEPPERTARRELVEEVGFEAGRLEPLTAFEPSPGMTDSVTWLFLATDLSPAPRTAHGPEEQHMEVLQLALEEALGQVVRGEITDAKTVIGLLLAARRVEGLDG